MVKNCRIRLFVSTEYTNVADRQMDRQRRCDGIAHAYAEHRSAKMVPEKRIVLESSFRETSCPRNGIQDIIPPDIIPPDITPPGQKPPGQNPLPNLIGQKPPRTKAPPNFYKNLIDPFVQQAIF